MKPTKSKDKIIKQEIEQIMTVINTPEIIEKKFNFRFVVKFAFDQYQKGQIIFSDDDIQAVIDKGQVRSCCKVPY
jgi:hypothetical protein